MKKAVALTLGLLMVFSSPALANLKKDDAIQVGKIYSVYQNVLARDAKFRDKWGPSNDRDYSTEAKIDEYLNKTLRSLKHGKGKATKADIKNAKKYFEKATSYQAKIKDGKTLDSGVEMVIDALESVLSEY